MSYFIGKNCDGGQTGKILLEAFDIEKSFADRQVLTVKHFRVYAGDRLGFVGANGCGKTTFLNILFGETEPDKGLVRRYCDIAYIRQFDKPGVNGESDTEMETRWFSAYGVLDIMDNENISGGEATRIRIAKALSEGRRLLFADEPTSNMDTDGIKRFSNALNAFESFILVSHDRALLNRYCNKIITVENGLTVYEGGYDAYKTQTDRNRERAAAEFAAYTAEKERLRHVYADKKAKAAKAVRKPKGMSSSEMKQRAFITQHPFEGKQQRFDRAAKAVQKRIDHMDVKEKPVEPPRIRLDFSLTEPPQNKIVLSGTELCFAYGERVLFEGASFAVPNRERIALTGPNGCGKTTLFNIISKGDECIYQAPKARVGYFYQGFENIDINRTVLWNAMNDGIQSETVTRSVLARLLFTRDDIRKPAGVLSGGERVKLSIAKLLVSANNILLLDEPTNYLDMPSIEVLQAILGEYEGTLLLVSHDNMFVDAVCTEQWRIEDRLIKTSGSRN